MNEKKRRYVHHSICWLGFCWLHKVITLIFYSVFFTSAVAKSTDYETNDAFIITVVSSFVSIILFAVVTAVVTYNNSNSGRREAVLASREPDFGFIRYFKHTYLVKVAISTGVYFATQLVFCGFYSAFGYRYTTQTGGTFLERIHVADAGFVLLTRNGIVGVILNTLSFFILICLARAVVLHLWINDKVYKNDG